MNAAARAIETVYHGVRFRSRLEARWATFYNALGVRWMYETEGFELPSGRYLPDFFMPDMNSWIEIKPIAPTRQERTRCAELANDTGKRVLLFYGPVEAQDPSDTESAECYFPGGGMDYHYMWCSCPCCGRFGVEFDGRGARVCIPAPNAGLGRDPERCVPRWPGDRLCHRKETCACGDKSYTHDNVYIFAAYEMARTARFW